ncbi:hypothetical protein RhiirB3_452875, partial [Rhizophagus irregularis]
MPTVQRELVYATANRAYSLIDYNIHTDMHKRYEFQKQFIPADKLLTDDEKSEAINYITETYDRNKVRFNSGTKRICENCKQESNRAYSLIDYNIHIGMHKQHEFQKQFILDDKLLTDDEKTEAINYITETYDRNKILYNSEIKRICENCNQECLATLYCEYC